MAEIKQPVYYPEYVPQDREKFDLMIKETAPLDTPENFMRFIMLYTFDMSYPREDILVVIGRKEREYGWKL